MDPQHRPSRRQFLASSTLGVGSLALAWLLNEEGLLTGSPRPELQPHSFDLVPRSPHFAPRARAMISLFMQGGPSHLDLLDPKPALARYAGQTFPGSIKYYNAAQASARVLGSPKTFFSAARPPSSTMSWDISSRRVSTSLSSAADQLDRPRPPIRLECRSRRPIAG